MYDRGHHRGFASAVEDEARGRRGAPDEAPRRDLTAAADVHDRPRQRRRTSTTRSRPSATATSCGCTCTSPTSPAFVRPGTALDAEAERRGNSVYVPGAVEPMLPRGAVQRGVQPRARACRAPTVTVEMLLDARRAGAQRVLLPQHDPLRRAARSTSEVDRRLRRARAGARGGRRAARAGARAGRAAARRGGSRAARSAVESSEPEFDFDDAGQRGRRPGRGPDRVALGDRAPHDPRQRAGGGAPRRPRASAPSTACTSSPTPPRSSASWRSSRASTCRRRRCPST